MSLQLIVGNRYEVLKTAYLASITPSSVLQNRLVIIPHAAIGRDLRLSEAGQLSISMGVEYDYFAEWVTKLAKKHQISNIFNSEYLAEQIFSYLNDEKIIKENSLQKFLQATDQLTHYYFAVKLSKIFERYLVQRVNWLELWSNSRETKVLPNNQLAVWQRDLWQYLLKKQQIDSWQSAAKLIMAKLDKRLLPEQLVIFCAQDYSDDIQELLIELGKKIEVLAFFISPCAEFWGDSNERSLLKKQLAQQSRENATYTDYVINAAPLSQQLLGSWGKPAQYFWQRWQKYHEYQEYLAYYSFAQDIPRYFPSANLSRQSGEVLPETQNKSTTLLNYLQNNWLNLSAQERLVIDEDDDSLLIHCCHSYRRQVEVCYQQILTLLSENQQIAVDEILVITPQLQQFAPLINAIWREHGQLPFQISGMSNEVSQLQQAFLSFAELIGDDISAYSLIEILRKPLVARNFKLNSEDVDSLQQALAQSATIGETVANKHNWQSGFSKLFLAYATDSQNNEQLIFANSIATPALTGKKANAYGGLWAIWQLCQQLQRQVKEINNSNDCWKVCQRLLREGVLDDKQLISEKQQLLSVIWQIANKLEGKLSWAVFLVAIKAELSKQRYGGVASGKITLSNLHSFRYLPYKAIFILGLEGQVFPQQNAINEYDLLTLYPKYGDQQNSDFDKNLFLDLIMAARVHLSIFFNGKDQRALQEQTPSLLISDLLIMIKSVLPEQQKYHGYIEHSLNSYAQEYFVAKNNNVKNRQNYDQNSWKIAKILQSQQECQITTRDHKNNILLQIVPEIAETEEIRLEELSEFFSDSGRYWLKRHCAINTWDNYYELSENAPLQLEKKDVISLKRKIYYFLKQNQQFDNISQLLTASAELPCSDIYEQSNQQINQLIADVWQFYQQIKDTKSTLTNKYRLELLINNQQKTLIVPQLSLVNGSLSTIKLDEKFKIKTIWQLWLNHLVLAQAGASLSSSYCYQFSPVVPDKYFQENTMRYEVEEIMPDEAKEYLQRLVEIYCQYSNKLLVFPINTAWALLTENLSKANEKWYKPGNNLFASSGESQYESWKLLLEAEQLDYQIVANLNTEILQPLHKYLKKA